MKARVIAYLDSVACDFDRKAMNPPEESCIVPEDIPPEWVSVGYVPRPTTKFGWFVYHFVHGIAMRYPLRAVIAFSISSVLTKEDEW